MIRRADLDDIPGILRLGLNAFNDSRFSDEETFVDVASAQAFLAHAIGQQGDPETYATHVLIAEEEGQIIGLLIGVIRPLYEVLSRNMLTHVIWYVAPGADGRLAMRLMNELHAWADQNGPVLKVHSITNSIIAPSLLSRLMRIAGFKQVGAIYEKE